MPTTRDPKLNVYLVSNEKALVLRDREHILTTPHTAITKLTCKTSPVISLDLCKIDPRHIDNHTAYTDPYPNTHDPTIRPKKSHSDHSAQHGAQISPYTKTDPKKRGTPH